MTFGYRVERLYDSLGFWWWVGGVNNQDDRGGSGGLGRVCAGENGDVTLVLRLERLYEFLSFWWGVSTWMRWEWWFG